MVDSDQLFKELLKTFFGEFLELFFFDLLADIEMASIEFPYKEYFTELLTGERRTADIVAKVKVKRRKVFFLIHIENQGNIKSERAFQRRQFFYAADLHRQTGLPVYSIAVLYGDKPRRPHNGYYTMGLLSHVALKFNYQVVQLNQYDWRQFVAHDNPAAAALMAKMRIGPAERPAVKAACLRMMVGLSLSEVERHLIGGFIDIYLPLSKEDKGRFEREVAGFEPKRRKRAMEIVTSWEREGIEKGIKIGVARGKREGKREGKLEGKREGKLEGKREGIKIGKQEGATQLALRLLKRRIETISPVTLNRVRQLSLPQLERMTDAVFGFTKEDDVIGWLNNNPPADERTRMIKRPKGSRV